MVSFSSGNVFTDHRGKLLFNNNIDLSLFKRLYIIENSSLNVRRGWQGHKIEKRFFCVSRGSFLIKVVKIDDFENPSTNLVVQEYILKALNFDSLLLSSGYATLIQELEEDSQLLAFSDYLLGEVDDNYKYDLMTWK
ncbi:sugar epimerase [Myroides odoratimimus]|nr:sugar epimerase [Myroides odoratimimus]